MKKYILDFRVVENTKLHDNYALLKLKPDNNEPLPDMLPGQFVEDRVDRSRYIFKASDFYQFCRFLSQ